MSNITLEQPAFTAADRCDRCGARAQVRVVLLNGEILLCEHHGREHADALAEQAVRIDRAQPEG